MLEITEDFAKEHNLTPEQVEAVKGHAVSWHESTVAELKGEWDNKANNDAQAILDGALKLVSDTTKVQRNEGEKAGEYIPRAWNEFSKAGQTEIERLKGEYQTKLKEFKGDEATQAELQKAKEALDEAQKKYADYDELIEYREKYQELNTQHLSMKEEVCFGKAHPSFPDTVNEYEAKAKWNEFVNGVKKDWDVELVDGEPMAINKENRHKTTKLSELVAKDAAITELMKGRTQNGTGAKPKAEGVAVDGIPFPISKDTSTKERATLIQEYLTKKGLNPISQEFSKEYGELNTKILVWQQTA